MTGNFPRRGEIYWVSLDPSVGSETKKTRPCLIISNDKGNAIANTVIIAPITSKIKKVYSFEVRCEIDGKQGKIMINQCRAIDKSRIGKKAGSLNEISMNEVDEAIRVTFELT